MPKLNPRLKGKMAQIDLEFIDPTIREILKRALIEQFRQRNEDIVED